MPGHALDLFNAFYRAGALVFGGGHVVLPLLQAAVVPPGWVSNDAFLAGYGATQAVPGPLFTFSAYLGTVMGPSPNGWAGAALCLFAMFLPAFLLVIGPMPFWDALRQKSSAQAALRGVNAAVVGFCSPRFTVRSGRPASPMPAISRSASSRSCCCSCGRRRRGWSSPFARSAGRLRVALTITTRRIGVPRRDRRDFGRIFRRRIAAPDHVHIGPHQNEIVAVDVARDAIRHVEHRDRRAARAQWRVQARRHRPWLPPSLRIV